MSLFAGYVVAVIGAVLGLLLVITAQVDPKGNAALQTLLGDLFSPISRAGRAVIIGGRNAGDSVAAYFNAASKNKEMEAELRTARQKLLQGQADALENRRLKRALRLTELSSKPVVAARLVSSTGASSRRFAILGAGASQGVIMGDPVISSEGLVGRVAALGRQSARVQMIIDAETVVPVKRLSDGIPALTLGLGDGRLEARALAAGSNPFRPRDILVTSGAGGVYRPGIPVAIVVRVQKDMTVALPLAEPARLDFGIVEREFMEQPPAPAGELPKADN